ncbi:MAG: aspartate dehydrogenase [Candidatus Omnitrophota bacterium]|jgi:aspartate dehydrogenase
MDGKLRIGIVGCGAIGTSLAKAVLKEFSKKAVVAALYDISPAKSRQLSEKISKDICAVSLLQLIEKSDLVVEAASAKVSYKVAKEVLGFGKDIMIMSVGGIVDKLSRLKSLAIKNSAKVYIPSGAICGIDALKAAKFAQIKKVTLTTTKHPKSFMGVEYVRKKGINLGSIKGERVLFSGRADKAVKNFPQNINVAAVLSLAGMGAKKTAVKIVASSLVTKNIHEIRIESSSGKITTRTENVLHPDNPKTSYLAVLSAIAALGQILEPVRIGT